MVHFYNAETFHSQSKHHTINKEYVYKISWLKYQVLGYFRHEEIRACIGAGHRWVNIRKTKADILSVVAQQRV